MSTTAITGATIPATTTTSSSSPSATGNTPSSPSSSNPSTNLGIGYIIAGSLGFLFLLGACFLAFYVCIRRRPTPAPLPTTTPSPSPILPRVVFITSDDDDDDDHESSSQNRSPAGLDPAAISSYPKFPFSKATFAGDNVCSICLCEYREGETLRMMPDCRHYFHLTCVDAWLRLNASCPVCRTSPMPTPLSTPLSELVPLSHYAADRRRR